MSNENKEVVIDPRFRDIYTWKGDLEESNAVISIKVVDGFDPAKVTVALNDKKNAISVRYPDQPPIIEGQLFGEVKGVSTQLVEDGKVFKIIIEMLKQEDPEILVTDIHPDTHQLDPMSSYIIFSDRAKTMSDALSDEHFKYLEFGLNANFVPSLLTAAEIFQHVPDLASKAIELYIIAADKYDASPAQLQLGLLLIRNQKFERGFEFIERASKDKQFTLPSIILGILLSPIADMEYPKKDAKRAAAIFEEVLKTERSHIALHELAMLYYNGIGVAKDEAKAKELNEEAAKINGGEVPPLEVRDETYKPKPMVDECGCGHCHCHEHEHEHEHEHCHCHEGENHECCGKCDGKGGCGKCDGKCGCGDHCGCHDKN
ncbi:hypothetical protein TVAG_106710 [Trichomonas vaginalis G3]|uniref:Uncharacterized protein n=1 Tax=Trichomonas vaginalis (strain ATCC PRA-98 / G3) TaxID=412133 RepID=A2E6G3_TRIV3|nr:tetratricopeptide repeat domain domain-containing protein [Trichomonas vaginalis G3]EAY11776.1 hypothetical protein TVAG_106710 [Trichomonas vaginalis G3]KAI5540645.1 tetratricopeptide repeat domain domain-containing protein [Trichomonas vaginalis G3]|eukprot:XP_001323999.1 hypothetical protein [Trichomonas vaginalis G3]